MNLRLALQEEGAKEYAALLDRHAKLMQELAAVRAELHQLEDLAFVAGIDLRAPTLVSERKAAQ